MIDLATVVEAATVGESIAKLIFSVTDHLRGKSAVEWKPALAEIEAAVPEFVTAVRNGTVAETEDGSLAGDGDRGDAAAAAAGESDAGGSPDDAAEDPAGQDPGDEDGPDAAGEARQ